MVFMGFYGVIRLYNHISLSAWLVWNMFLLCPYIGNRRYENYEIVDPRWWAVFADML